MDKYASAGNFENAHFLAGDVAKVLRAVAEGIVELPAEVAKPDVVVIVTDDEGELFHDTNRPAIAIYHGDEIVTHPRPTTEGAPPYVDTMVKRYAMDKVHRFPAMGDFAYELIEGMIARHVDVAARRGAAPVSPACCAVARRTPAARRQVDLTTRPAAGRSR